MDKIERHEAQRMATDAIKAFIDLMYEYDPRKDFYTVRYSQITGQELHRIIQETVGRIQPLTVEDMEASVTDALSRRRDE